MLSHFEQLVQSSPSLQTMAIAPTTLMQAAASRLERERAYQRATNATMKPEANQPVRMGVPRAVRKAAQPQQRATMMGIVLQEACSLLNDEDDIKTTEATFGSCSSP